MVSYLTIVKPPISRWLARYCSYCTRIISCQYPGFMVEGRYYYLPGTGLQNKQHTHNNYQVLLIGL